MSSELGRVNHMSDYDHRYAYRCFHIDTNRINASGSLEFMNQLERWHEAGVIQIEMAERAQGEAARGGASRAHKAYGYVYTMTMAGTKEEADYLRRIEGVLFPDGVKSQNEQNDVEIVFNAKKYGCILVTDDGGSHKQPGGILGNRERLRLLGIEVLTDREAVAVVRQLIRDRDERERRRSSISGQPLPEWVGRD